MSQNKRSRMVDDVRAECGRDGRKGESARDRVKLDEDMQAEQTMQGNRADGRYGECRRRHPITRASRSKTRD
jgi:hypothetical protein